MADYSFGYGGIGSGLDISTIVSQLVSAERAPQDARLNKLEAVAKFKLSGLGGIASAFDTLKSSLDALQKSDALGVRKVQTLPAGGAGGGSGGAGEVLAATAGRSTPVGRYQVDVISLASAHRLVGGAVESGTTFGAGSLQIAIGDSTLDVAIPAGATLAEVRGAINTAAGSHGVQAAVFSSDGGQHLSLSASRTGSTHAISISVTDGGADLQGLVDGLAERSPATDAQVTIDGFAVSASGNTLADAVPGLSLQLQRTGAATIDVSADAAGSREAVEGFVNAYNGALKAIRTATSYNSETKASSSLTGDAQVRGAASQLRSTMGGLLADLAAQGLDANTLGLQTRGYPDVDGSLVLDAAAFDAAMRDNAAGVIAAFTGEDGLASRLNTVVRGYVGSEGSFTTRNTSLNDQIKDVGVRREALDTRMSNVARRYQAQFVALDALMAQMSTTSNYLAQQLSALSAQAQAR